MCDLVTMSDNNTKSRERRLEVCIDSMESASNAIHGGADEIEVCSSLAEGGLTPTAGLVKIIVQAVSSVLGIIQSIHSVQLYRYLLCTYSCLPTYCHLLCSIRGNLMRII